VAYSHPFGSVADISPSTGVTSAENIREASSPLLYGGMAAAASDLPVLLSFEVLDLEVRTVLGFDGRGPVRLAFERGELNLDYQVTPVYLTQVVPSVEAGSGVGIASVTYAYGQTAYMHPDTPQEGLDIFAEAVAAINADPEFQAESQAVTGGARLSSGPETEAAVKAALSPSQEVRDYLWTLHSDKYAVNL
jgi:hypothetical protein